MSICRFCIWHEVTFNRHDSASCIKTCRNSFFSPFSRDPFKHVARIFEVKSRFVSDNVPTTQAVWQILHEVKREIKSGRVNDRHVYPVTGYKRESRIRSTRGSVFRFYLRLACSHREAIDLISKVATPGKRVALRLAWRDTCP